MSADLLRKSAALMRERAQAATPSPWGAVAGAYGDPANGPDHMRVVQAPHHGAYDAVARTEYEVQGGADAAHIAGMHPAVALALADWLDDQARYWDAVDAAPAYMEGDPAAAVARAYLGES